MDQVYFPRCAWKNAAYEENDRKECIHRGETFNILEHTYITVGKYENPPLLSTDQSIDLLVYKAGSTRLDVNPTLLNITN